MILVTIFSTALMLTTLLPTAISVIFTKGSENYYDNAYLETTTSTFQQECLDWHNYFRQLHGSPPLTYSPDLERIARYRAIELAKKDGTNFYHHDNMDVGENLAWNSQEPIDCRIPLQLWYDEWKIYDFKNPHITARNGHFAQMIWKDSRRIGCGQAISKGSNGGTYTVCNYDPPGNWKNEELQNVAPPIHGYGIEWNPLGSNSVVQLPPVTNKWSSSSASKSYYYGPQKSTSTASSYYNNYNNYNSYTNKYKYNKYPYDYSRYNSLYKKTYPRTSSYYGTTGSYLDYYG